MIRSLFVLITIGCSSPKMGIGPDATASPDAAIDATIDTRPRLMVLLHSYGTNPAALAGYWDESYWQSKATLYVPFGSKNSKGVWTFNASESCCQDTLSSDDEGIITAAIEAMGSYRVYVVGFSNGGFMAQRLACDRPDLFAAAVNLSGAGRSEHDAPCRADMAPTLLVHGTADPTIHYDVRGRFATMPDEYLTAAETLAQYGCGAFTSTSETRDYDIAVAGAETDVMTAPNCRSEHWRMNNSTHGPTFNAQWYVDVWQWLETR